MEETQKLKIVYGKSEYGIGQQELDRVIAIASKKLRNELISAKLGMGIFPIRDLASLEKENSDIKVFYGEFESEFYKEMNETLLYALESDMLENFRVSKESTEKIQNNGNMPQSDDRLQYKKISYKNLISIPPDQLFLFRLKQNSYKI